MVSGNSLVLRAPATAVCAGYLVPHRQSPGDRHVRLSGTQPARVRSVLDRRIRREGIIGLFIGAKSIMIWRRIFTHIGLQLVLAVAPGRGWNAFSTISFHSRPQVVLHMLFANYAMQVTCRCQRMIIFSAMITAARKSPRGQPVWGSSCELISNWQAHRAAKGQRASAAR